ncbi:hypothetical protein ABTZ59_28915 [Streptomyces sp. NPDC094034]|uniref:hypothetical protein n=1 Tax=Streptomyces sp. NPDC094034 TaxID=3155309 RepID=UPI00332DB3C1
MTQGGPVNKIRSFPRRAGPTPAQAGALRGTTATFLNSDRGVRRTSRAPRTGTAAWTPVFYVVPC